MDDVIGLLAQVAGRVLAVGVAAVVATVVVILLRTSLSRARAETARREGPSVVWTEEDSKAQRQSP